MFTPPPFVTNLRVEDLFASVSPRMYETCLFSPRDVIVAAQWSNEYVKNTSTRFSVDLFGATPTPKVSLASPSKAPPPPPSLLPHSATHARAATVGQSKKRGHEQIRGAEGCGASDGCCVVVSGGKRRDTKGKTSDTVAARTRSSVTQPRTRGVTRAAAAAATAGAVTAAPVLNEKEKELEKDDTACGRKCIAASLVGRALDTDEMHQLRRRDPVRYKRITCNRASARRSKERREETLAAATRELSKARAENETLRAKLAAMEATTAAYKGVEANGCYAH